MPDFRVDSIYNLTAIEEEQAKFLAFLAQSKSAILDLNNQRIVVKASDISSFTPASENLHKTITATDTATKSMTNAVTAQNQVIGQTAKILSAYGNSLQQNITNLNSYKKALDTNKLDQKEAIELRKLGVLSEEDYKKKMIELTEAQFRYKEAISATSKEIKNQTQLNLSVPTSITEARSQNKILTTQRDLLPTTDKAGIAELNALIDRNNKLIDTNSDKLARQKINIGNYSGAVSFLKESLTEVGRKIDENTKAGQANSEVTEKLRKEYEILDRLINSQAAGFTKASMEVRENEKALLEMSQAGLEGTEAFKKLSQATGKLKDDIGDVSARTKALGSDTFAFDSMIQGAQALAGAYGVAQGAAALFGNENEELQKTFVKLQAIMTVIQGLQSIQSATQKESAFMLGVVALKEKALVAVQTLKSFILKGTITATKEATVAENLRTAALTKTTVATRVATGAMITLRAALIATGIGALLLLLPAIANGMGLFSDNTKKATDSMNELNAAVETNNRLLNESIANMDQQGQLLLEKLKQRGATQKEIDEQEIKNMRAKEVETYNSYKRQKDALDKFDADTQKGINTFRSAGIKEDDIEKFVKDRMEASQKLRDQTVKDHDTAISLMRQADLKEAQIRTNQINDERTKAKTASDNYQKELQESLKRAQAYREATAAELAKMNQKEVQDEKDKYKAIADDQKKSLIERTQAIVAYNEAGKRLLDLQKNDSESLLDAEIEKDKKAAKTKEELAAIETVRKAKQATIDKTFASDSAKFQTEVLGLFRTSAEDDYKRIEEAATKTYEKIKQAAEQSFSDQKDQIDIDKNDKLLQLNKDYNEGRIKNLEEYNTKSAAIEQEGVTRQKELELERLKASEAVFEMQSFGLLKNYDFLKQISDLEVDLTKTKTEKILELEKQLQDKKKELQNQAFETFSAFIDGGYEKQKNSIQDQINLNEEKTQRDIELVNASAASEQEKADRITIIQARADAQKTQLERKQKDADIKKAMFDKEMAILRIGITTAQAVAEITAKAAALFPFGAILAAQIPFVIATGALEIAAIAASPIPKYKHGRGEKGEEFAIVGDGGVNEYIMRGTGQIEKTPAVNTLTHLMPKDKVYPNKESLMRELMFNNMQLSNYSVGQDGGINRNDIERLGNRLEDSISGIRIQTQLVTKSGWRNHNERLAKYDAWVDRVIKN